MVLYRKYRPQALSEVVGQDHIRDPLLAALRGGKITHAYLFSGPRGTGKTSVARILAKAVNCMAYGPQTTDHSNQEKNRGLKAVDRGLSFGEPCNECAACLAITAGSYLDLIEIDAASNRGIDEIRDLREKIKLSPAGGRFKVYIIDEAHMLTPEAFNALLKTLEEPPPHAIFILATTEPQKIPATIASRTTRFDFKVPTVGQIQDKLLLITKKEDWGLSETVLEEVARAAGGAFRDAEVLLEKVASVDSGATLEKTREILGRQEATSALQLLNSIQEGRTREALIWLHEYLSQGGGVRLLAESVLEALRKILLWRVGAESAIELVTEEEMEFFSRLAKTTTKERLLKLTSLFNRAIDELRNATIPQLPLEIAIIEASLEEDSSDDEKTATTENTEIKIDGTEDKKTATTETPATVEAQKDLATPPRRQAGAETQKKVEAQKNAETRKMEAAESKILKKLQKDWGKFLKEVKPKNSSLESFLRQAKPIDLDEDLLTIEFPFRFHKEKVEERKYRDVVEGVLEKFIGSPLRIKGVVGERPPEVKKVATAENTDKKEDVDPAEVFGKLD